MLGVLAANNLGLALLWLESAKLFGQWQCQGDMACPNFKFLLVNHVKAII
jgi:hypothetical protein